MTDDEDPSGCAGCGEVEKGCLLSGHLRLALVGRMRQGVEGGSEGEGGCCEPATRRPACYSPSQPLASVAGVNPRYLRIPILAPPPLSGYSYRPGDKKREKGQRGLACDSAACRRLQEAGAINSHVVDASEWRRSAKSTPALVSALPVVGWRCLCPGVLPSMRGSPSAVPRWLTVRRTM